MDDQGVHEVTQFLTNNFGNILIAFGVAATLDAILEITAVVVVLIALWKRLQRRKEVA